MKKLAVIVLLVTVTGCGTVGGTLSGAGTDLQKAGEWIRSK